MSKATLQRMYAHMWWAEEAVWKSLRAPASLPHRALNIYAHLVAAETVWIDRIEGAGQSVAVWPSLDLDECIALARTSRERYQRCLEAMAPETLDRIIHYANSSGQEFATRVDDILLHVAMHGSYHRGQIALLLRDANAVPCATDYITFVRDHLEQSPLQGG